MKFLSISLLFLFQSCNSAQVKLTSSKEALSCDSSISDTLSKFLLNNLEHSLRIAQYIQDRITDENISFSNVLGEYEKRVQLKRQGFTSNVAIESTIDSLWETKVVRINDEWISNEGINTEGQVSSAFIGIRCLNQGKFKYYLSRNLCNLFLIEDTALKLSYLYHKYSVENSTTSSVETQGKTGPNRIRQLRRVPWIKETNTFYVLDSAYFPIFDISIDGVKITRANSYDYLRFNFGIIGKVPELIDKYGHNQKNGEAFYSYFITVLQSKKFIENYVKMDDNDFHIPQWFNYDN